MSQPSPTLHGKESYHSTTTGKGQELLDDQRQRRKSGEPILVEQYLRWFPDLAADPEAVLELIYQEIVLRQEANEKPEAAEYIQRFPQWTHQVQALFQVDEHLREAGALQSLSIGVGSDAVFPVPLPKPPALTPPQLLQEITEIGLLNPRQLESIAPLHTIPETSEQLLSEMIRRGWLTQFQVDELQAGRGRSLVLGDYLLQKKLGIGGMGEIYLALHRRLGRFAAVKLVRRGLMDRSRDRFFREAQAVARVMHPNIVTLYEAGEINGNPFLAMEYVAGPDLHGHVRECGPMAIQEATEYVRQAALGLHFAHQRGLIHRDIKPGNILLAPSPGAGQPRLVKILDFGLARMRVADELGNPTHTPITELNQILGTPDFMAPEQFESANRIDSRADVYSLGCTLFYLLTGRPPFTGASLWEKLNKHKSAEFPSLHSFRSDIPEELDALVRKMTAKSPEERPESAEEVAQALAPFAGGCFPTLNPTLNPTGIPDVLPSITPRSSTLILRSPNVAPTGTEPAPHPIQPTPAPPSATPDQPEEKTGLSVRTWLRIAFWTCVLSLGFLCWEHVKAWIVWFLGVLQQMGK